MTEGGESGWILVHTEVLHIVRPLRARACPKSEEMFTLRTSVRGHSRGAWGSRVVRKTLVFHRFKVLVAAQGALRCPTGWLVNAPRR